jgi:hypothetical protein
VIETEPDEENRLLATTSGLGLAYPVQGGFGLFWPASPGAG